MKRVETLCNRLKEQLSQSASVNELLVTVQLLQSELLHLKSNEQVDDIQKGAALNIATSFENKLVAEVAKEETPPEKTVEVLQIDEAEVEAELEEIKRNAEIRNNVSAHNKPELLFDPVEDIPTLKHQHNTEITNHKKEIHETISSENHGSLNDKLKQIKIELSESLQEVPIKDLKKAIGVNDRFLFVKELFRGDEIMYERSIKTINGFSIFPEAEYWIRRELKSKLGWNDANEIVKQFDHLIRRHFSSI